MAFWHSQMWLGSPWIGKCFFVSGLEPETWCSVGADMDPTTGYIKQSRAVLHSQGRGRNGLNFGFKKKKNSEILDAWQWNDFQLCATLADWTMRILSKYEVPKETKTVMIVPNLLSFLFFPVPSSWSSGKCHQDVQVQRLHVPAPESVRAVQESGQPLLPGSPHPAGSHHDKKKITSVMKSSM